MNIERLDKIINAYIDNFEMINNGEHFENMKWSAIHHYKENFDINAPDFYEMFKCAMSKSDIIINNGTVQPINGILKLISHEETMMRSLFAMLYEDDGGNLDKRQDKIERFVEETNKLLEKYERGKWKYKQDFRSVLAYLTFYKPEENYLYKSSQCQPFFRYLEHDEEIGYGQHFKLSRYYRMCDEVRYALSKHPDLMRTHETRWNKVENPQDNFHILVFDIIYCSIVYEFYEHQKYNKIIRKSKFNLEQELLSEKYENTRTEMESLEVELAYAQAKLDEIPEINLEGQNVKHRMFGKGLVARQSGSYIEVVFASKTSKFILTTAFVGGFLSSEDVSILERCKQIESAITLCNKLEKAIKSKQTELDLLIAKINPPLN